MSIPPVKVLVAVTNATALSRLGETTLLVSAASVAREFSREVGQKGPITVAFSEELSIQITIQLKSAGIDFFPLVCDPNNPVEFAQALATVVDESEFVVIHDANRPLTRISQFHRALESLLAEGDVVRCSSAFTETLKSVSNEALIEYTIDRTSVRRISTPEVFKVSAIDFKQNSVEKCTGWFLPLKPKAQIGYVDSDPESIRVNSSDELSLLESFLHWQKTVAR